ncbi:MFS transporter [Phenylobacterium immobile]|uniref:MFS transporter n=1 Tax=Phenylobacterium immobile TaxID=21 RepID=UPI000A6A99A0|nr:MFS transporter [Phenylobacterium immobile]
MPERLKPEAGAGGGAVLVAMGAVFLSLVGFGIVVPLLPFYRDVFGASAWEVTLMSSVFAAGQFFGELFWGRLSDRIGRKPIIIATILFSGLGYVALAYAPTMGAAIAARAVSGFFCGNISTIQGYIVDVSPRDRLAGRLGMIGSAFGIGFIVGPTLGGLLARPELGVAGFRPPLLAAAGLCAMAVVCTFLFVRESGRRQDSSAGKSRPVGADVVRRTLSDTILRRYVAATFLSFGGFSAMFSTFGLWGAARFDWGPRDIGMVLAFTGIASAASQGLVSGWASRRIGEANTAIIGLSVAAMFLLAEAFGPPATVAAIIIVGVTIFHTLSQPAGVTLVSRAAPDDEQGATLGVNNAASAAARVLGPMSGGLLFSLFGESSPFLLAPICMVAAALMTWSGSRETRRRRLAEEGLPAGD